MNNIVITPKVIRLPKPKSRCPYTGLSRATLYRWITPSYKNGFNPPVRSYCVRTNPKARKGIRWVDMESLEAYIMGNKTDKCEVGGAK